MRFAWDLTTPPRKLLFIYVRELAEGEHVARTVEVDLGTMADEDAGGNLLGIEVLSPEAPWPLRDIMGRWPIPADDLALIMGSYMRAPSALASLDTAAS